ncbi:MAG: alkyl hydroperoxide reductase [Robiginitomaculum sp.]|nr:MAG: alkyl hydroperoxide reductase [Robiginitomaculum sp.]
MNFIKSVFIANYMMAAMALAIYSGWMMSQGGDVVAWSGSMLTTLPIVLVISYLMMLQTVARTSAHFPLLSLLAAIGVGLAGWSWFQGGMGRVDNPDAVPFALAASGFVGLLIYSYWFSSFGGRTHSDRIKLGSPLPAFSLVNVKGESLASTDLVRGPAILIFYRGNWCPLCMAQVKELVGKYNDLSKFGVRVALISPQPHRYTQSLAKKFNVDFDFLTDKGNHAARVLGIDQNFGVPLGMQMFGYKSETVLPTVIITDGDGKVIWTHETDNYRIRPEPDTFLEVLRRHGIVVD